MNIIESIIERAKADKQRIVLPEGTEKRTLQAADQLLRDGVAEIILLGNSGEINALAKQLELENISKARIVDPKSHDKKETYTNLLVELRKKKGMTPEEAAVLVEDPLYLACLMIKYRSSRLTSFTFKDTASPTRIPVPYSVRKIAGITLNCRVHEISHFQPVTGVKMSSISLCREDIRVNVLL